MDIEHTPQKILLPLDHTRTGPRATEFYDFIKSRAVGQPRIFKWCAETSEAILQGFYPENGPAASVLLVGPSGVGKTYIIKLLAEFFFGDPKGFVRIDGQDISLEHEVSRIKGAPPGYKGYGDEPMITQKKLDWPAHRAIVNLTLQGLSAGVRKDYHNLQKERVGLLRHLAGVSNVPKPDIQQQKLAQEKLEALAKRVKEMGIPVYDREKYEYISLMLLDEIERAHRDFHNLLFRVLDEGELPLESLKENGEKDSLDFHRTIIVATSNLGSDEITKMLQSASGRSTGYGFMKETYAPDELDMATYRTCRNAVDKFFSTEFVNRFGDVVAARPHSRENLLEILDIEIEKLSKRLSDISDLDFPLTLHIDRSVKEYLIDEVSDHLEKGIRFLQQKLSTRILRAISTLKSTDQLSADDILHVSLDPASKKKLFFQKEEHIKLPSKTIVVE